MKLMLRLCLSTEAQKKALRSGVISEDQLSYGTLDVDSASDLFANLMDETRNTADNSMLHWIQHTKGETNAAELLEVQPVKTVGEASADYSVNSDHLLKLPWVKTGALQGIKLPDRLTLSKLSAAWKPHNVAGLDQWTEEYIVGPDVVSAWRKKKFTGFRALPLTHRRTQQPLDGAAHLYCNRIMPPVAPDPTIVLINEEGDPCMRRLGSLVYEQAHIEKGLADFNRTAEPFRACGMGILVVKRAVADHFNEMKFKGIRFVPVLVRGSEQHQVYLQLWEGVFEAASLWKDFSFAG